MRRIRGEPAVHRATVDSDDVACDHVSLIEVLSVEASDSKAHNWSYALAKAEDEVAATSAREESAHGHISRNSRVTILNILTRPEGKFNGRSFPIKFSNVDDYASWSSAIKSAVKHAHERNMKSVDPELDPKLNPKTG